jgi:hypothetical protein
MFSSYCFFLLLVRQNEIQDRIVRKVVTELFRHLKLNVSSNALLVGISLN